MKGIADARIEARILARLAEGPAAVEALLAVARDAAGPAAPRAEGVLLALLHGLCRANRLEVVGRAPSGGAVYGLAGVPVAASPFDGPAPIPPPAPARHVRAALRAAARVRDPEDRGRVVADALAHLATLEAAGRASAFGATRARDALGRVDRGRATIVCPENAWERVVRAVRQEGPSLLATLALLAVLYVFVAEFRVVPTNSMRPGIAPADRLLVWKLGAGGTPDRFAILVFQVPKGPPLVKRVAGLSGEAVAIDRNGDLVVDGAVVVKPDDVREAMREPLVRADFTGPRVPDGWARGGDGALRYARPLFADDPAYLDERGVLELNPPERPLAHDVYVRARLAGPGELRLAFVDEQGRTTATYASGAAGAADVSIAVVDGRLWRNGRVVGPAEGARGHAEVSLSGGVASVEIDRDVHYTQPRDAQLAIDPAVPYRVPEGCVFMLGDHSAHSHDSRYADVGPISLQRVIGRVVFRVWPLPRLGRVP